MQAVPTLEVGQTHALLAQPARPLEAGQAHAQLVQPARTLEVGQAHARLARPVPTLERGRAHAQLARLVPFLQGGQALARLARPVLPPVEGRAHARLVRPVTTLDRRIPGARNAGAVPTLEVGQARARLARPVLLLIMGHRTHALHARVEPTSPILEKLVAYPAHADMTVPAQAGLLKEAAARRVKQVVGGDIVLIVDPEAIQAQVAIAVAVRAVQDMPRVALQIQVVISAGEGVTPVGQREGVHLAHRVLISQIPGKGVA